MTRILSEEALGKRSCGDHGPVCVRSLEMLYELLGAGDLEWTRAAGARLLRYGWLIFILLTTTNYTANLAAFFTTPQ